MSVNGSGAQPLPRERGLVQCKKIAILLYVLFFFDIINQVFTYLSNSIILSIYFYLCLFIFLSIYF